VGVAIGVVTLHLGFGAGKFLHLMLFYVLYSRRYSLETSYDRVFLGPMIPSQYGALTRTIGLQSQLPGFTFFERPTSVLGWLLPLVFEGRK